MIVVPGLYWILAAQGLRGRRHAHRSRHIDGRYNPNRIVSARADAKRGGVEWPLWRKWLPGVITGVIAGTLVTNHMPQDMLRAFFGLIMLALAAMLLMDSAIRNQKSDTRYIGRDAPAGRSHRHSVGNGRDRRRDL